MSDNTVGHVGSNDIGKEVILIHGNSHIRGILEDIAHDIERTDEHTVAGNRHTYYTVTTTLAISGVIVTGLKPNTPINTTLYGS